MAIKYFCDMCGVELSESYYKSASSLSFHCNKEYKLTQWADCNFETLCESCVKEVIRVLKETAARLKITNEEGDHADT